MLQKSLQYDPEFSESYFLLYQLSATEQLRTLDCLKYLQRAIAGHSWIDTDPSKALKELGRLLFRVRRFEEASANLQLAANERSDDPEVFILLAECLAMMGDIEGAVETVKSGINSFPGSIRLIVYYSYYLEWAKGARSAIRFLELMNARVPGSPDILMAAALIVEDSTAKAQFLEAFFSSGGRDPKAALLALRRPLW